AKPAGGDDSQRASAAVDRRCDQSHVTEQSGHWSKPADASLDTTLGWILLRRVRAHHSRRCDGDAQHVAEPFAVIGCTGVEPAHARVHGGFWTVPRHRHNGGRRLYAEPNVLEQFVQHNQSRMERHDTLYREPASVARVWTLCESASDTPRSKQQRY